jgi:predicted transcriptional regulator of viral defense system
LYDLPSGILEAFSCLKTDPIRIALTSTPKMYILNNKDLHFRNKDMTKTRIQKLESLFTTGEPILRTAVLRECGFCGKDIAELLQLGKLRKVRRGYYDQGHGTDTLNGFEVLASLVPEGVVSLFSAAKYHDLTTVIPQFIEITLPSTMRTPVLPENLHVKVYKSVIPIYQVGIETVQMDKVTIKMYDRERTVCDFVRMRLKIGKDAALEVLKNYMSGRKNLQKLYEYAGKLQIERVIHPYLEALV